VVTQKVKNPSFAKVGSHDEILAKASEESQRNERIARGTNRSTFLHLGEKKTQLVQEQEHPMLQRQKLPN